MPRADPAPRLSIVTVTFDAAAFIVPFLTAVDAARDAEVVIVDNASHDDTAVLVRRHLPRAMLMRSSENLGFAGACNQGAAVARGGILLFLNPDTVPPPDAPRLLWEAVATRPGTGAVGCKLRLPDGRIQSAGGRLRANGLTGHRGWGEVDAGQYDQEAVVDYVPGAALAMRRDLFLQMGGFHDGYFPGFYEDLELCWRLRERGYDVRYVPVPAIVHQESPSMGTRFDYWLHRNRMLFLARNPAAPRSARTEAGFLWREQLRPILRATIGLQPRALAHATRRLRNTLAGECAGAVAAWRARRTA